MLALGVGITYAAKRPPSAPEAPPGETLSTELRVTGTPPSTRPWQGGYEEVWRVDPSEILLRRDFGDASGGHGYAGRGSGVVVLTIDTATAGGAVVGVHESSGEAAWAEWSQEQCGGMVNGHLRCQGGRMGYYPTDLVELTSGRSTQLPSSQELGAKIPDGQEDYFGWHTFVIGGTLFAGWLDRPSDEGDPLMSVARFADHGSRFDWVTQPGFRPADWGLSSSMGLLEAGRLNHGIVTGTWGALDASTGSLILDGSGTDEPELVQWVAQDVLQGGGHTGAPTRIVAPDGSSVSIIEAGGISVTTAALPKYPLRKTVDGVAAFDPSTGSDGFAGPTLWSASLRPTTGRSILDSYLLAAYRDGLIAVASQPMDSPTGVVTMLAEDTGAVLWQASIPRSDPKDSLGVLVPVFSADGGLLVQAGPLDRTFEDSDFASELTMFDTDDGEVLWTRTGAVAGGQTDRLHSAPFALAVEQQHGIVVDNLDAPDYMSGSTYSMLQPRTQAETDSPPTSVPSCPAGMTAIAWTKYADGSILLCQADQRYEVVFPMHPEWRAIELNFAEGGHEVAFDNGVRVRVSLGGTVVYTDANGEVTATRASETWANNAGAVELQVPSDLATCPAGSWPISLSTYDGGWLLVCGTASRIPSTMFLSDGATTTAIDAVTSHNGGYCGTADIGTVCSYRSPAVVSITDTSGGVTQHSAASNYFDGHGQGGVGQGTGSYGVDAPDDNAQDQVRYLTEILQKSARGRASLQSAVDQVRSCTDLPGAIATFNDVIANRQELLNALESTPVDAVPDGAYLVARLRTALSLSYDSDQVWLQWAESERANGCAEGQDNPLYQQVRKMNGDVSVAKDAFIEAWNSQVVPAYGAPRFKTSQI